MRPTLRVGQPCLVRVVGVGAVAVREQDGSLGMRETQRLLYVFSPATLEERETHFVQLAIDGPEVRCLELSRFALPRLDRRLVHGLDARCADRLELRIVDRLEQRHALLANLREPRAAHRDAVIAQALMLAVERQVVGEFVDQQSGDETYIGAATLDDTYRRTRADDHLRCLELDHWTPIFQNDGAARALSQPVAVLVTDDLEGLRCKSFGFRSGELDHLDRYPRLVKERNAVIVAIGFLCHRPARMSRDVALNRCGRRGALLRVDGIPQTHLAIGAVNDPTLTLLAEDLTLEPVQLMLEGLDFLTQREMRTHQIDDLLRLKGGRFVET